MEPAAQFCSLSIDFDIYVLVLASRGEDLHMPGAVLAVDGVDLYPAWWKRQIHTKALPTATRESRAVFGPDRRWRYRLVRVWDSDKPRLG
jgi:hypothetical protein